MILHLIDDELVEVAVVNVPDHWTFPYRTARLRPFRYWAEPPGIPLPIVDDEWWPVAIDDTSAICRRR